MSEPMFHGGPIVIVGGGVVGCSLAFHLAVHGHDDVTVLESGLVGEGSTAKATGGIRQQFSSELNASLAHEAVGYYEDFETRVGEPFDFRQHGYLFLLGSRALREQFERDAQMQRALGIDVRLVDNDDIRELVPGVRVDDLYGGAYTPRDGSASPTDAAAAFARQARRRGVTIEQHTSVTGVRCGSDGRVVGVDAAGRSYAGELVVNAAGPWARRVDSMVGSELPVAPHPRQAFGIGPLERLGPSMPLTVDLASGAYLHPETAGGIVGGNDRDVAESWSAQVRWELTDQLIAALTDRVPWMSETRLTSGWCGLREMTPDDHAIVGPSDIPGWWYAVGFSGHGFMQAPVVGDHLARWILGYDDRRDLSALRPSRFDDGGTIAEATVF